MTGEDDGPTLRVELRPHTQAHFVGLPAKQRCVDRLHEGVHAIETFGSGTGRQPVEITVRTRDVTIRAACDVDDDVSALRHEYQSSLWRTGRMRTGYPPQNQVHDNCREKARRHRCERREPP